MNIIEKKQRLCEHMAESYSASELAEMLIELYDNEAIEDCYDVFES